MDAVLIFLMWFGVPAVLIFAIYQAILFFNRAAEKRELRRGGQSEAEQPLFALKYQPQRVAWSVFWASIVGIPVGLILTFNAHLAKTGFNVMLFITVGSLILIASIFQIIDSLLFKEIRVYKDRILKIWHLLGKREINFQDARMDGMRSPIVSTKKIFRSGTNVFLAPFKGIYYDENLARPQDIKKLNSILADLTGRKVEEFEKFKITFKKLIKEANNE